MLLVLGALALVLLYLFLWTRLAFVTAVIVLEGRGVWSAFARSWRLTAGTPFWRILGIRLLTSIIVGFAASIITFPLTLVGVGIVVALGDEQNIFMWQAIISGLASLISGAITTPFTAGVDALMADRPADPPRGPGRAAHPRGPAGRTRSVAERRRGPLTRCDSTHRWTPRRPRRGNGSRTSCARASTTSSGACSSGSGTG